MSDAATVARRVAEPEVFSTETQADSAPQAKILVVDDEPKSLFALQELLSTLGQNLMIAQSGEEALRLALKNDFAVILLDACLPGFDGFDTARRIGSRDGSRFPPATCLTAAAGLRPEMLKDMGLLRAAGWQAKEFQKRTGIRCRGKLPLEVKFDMDISTTMFRIFQEILTNVAPHSRATRVDIELIVSDERFG